VTLYSAETDGNMIVSSKLGI